MQKKIFDVLVAGELNVDIILDELEKFPATGKEVLANKMILTLGSSSAIFASNLSLLGSSVSFCGLVGNDSFGDKILIDLALKGVDISNISRSSTAGTGITVALNFNQERAMITYPGAMNEFQEVHISNEMLASARHLHVSSVFLQPALKPGLVQLLNRAKQSGLSTSLDPQWDPLEDWQCDWLNLLPYIDVFLPNIDELKHITQQASIEDAINTIKNTNNIIVVKDGIRGAMVFHNEDSFHQPAFINNEFADAIGAGDSFNSGFIHYFIQQKTLKQCAEFGALTGALNTTCSGGTTAFSTIDSIKKIALEKFNYRI